MTGAGTDSGTSGADSDPDGDAITWGGVVTGPSIGSVSCSAAGACSFTLPSICSTAVTSVTYRIRDARGGTATARVDIDHRYLC